MKHYVLYGTVNGRSVSPRSYLTRQDAEKRLSDILYRNDLQVEDDRFPQAHTEEFVCNPYTRFFIARVLG